jgi:hypothetical protein
MTNKEYFETVVNSNLDDEAKALALTVIVNSNENFIRGKSYTPHVSAYGVGCQNERVDVRASLMAMLFKYLLENGECRCKDIAKLYNKCVGVDDDAWQAVTYRVVAGITTPLVDAGIIERFYKPTVIEVSWCDYATQQTLYKQKSVDVPYFRIKK